jgi:hypothetical protein
MMKPRSEAKAILKNLRWSMRRMQAAQRWGKSRLDGMPVVIGNSMPKSGSHLIIQVLEGLPQIGPFINPGMPPLNRNEENSILAEKQIVRRIADLHPGDISYCYLAAEEPFLSLLTQPKYASIFIYRDPRDVIVSHVFYATEMHPTHVMRKYYTEQLTSMEERINAAILGVNEPGVTLTAIRKKYDRYLGWFDCSQVLSIRFEDLIQNPEAAISSFLKHLSGYEFIPDVDFDTAVNTLKVNIQPKKSGTFRKGKPGNWREHFTAENIRVFKENTGDLLVRLGYEKDRNW